MRPIRASDADLLAVIRGDVVRTGLLALLGKRARSAFFRAAANDRATFGLVTEDGEGVNGFVVVTLSARRIERAAILGNPSLWPLAIILGLRSPRSLARAVGQFVRVFGNVHEPSDQDEPALRLLDIAVADRARHRGYGRALLEAAAAEAWRRGHDAIGLSVLSTNDGAARLYEYAGYRVNHSGVRRDGHHFMTMRLDRPPGRKADSSLSHSGREPERPVTR
jgi:ribosomal protein S18 acetylase RimI-like enzyme